MAKGVQANWIHRGAPRPANPVRRHPAKSVWTRVRMIMTLDVDVTADWRSGPRCSILSVLCLVHPFPLRGTSPQGETRDMERKTGESYTSCTIPVFPPLVPYGTTFPPQAGALQGSAKPCTHKSLYFKHGLFATVHILHRMCKLVKVSPKPAHKRAFLLIDQPNCGGSPAQPERGASAASQSAECFSCSMIQKSKSRNADFILIAQRAIPQPSAPQALSLPERKRTQPFDTTCGASRAPFL